jgi:hypothetical protein
MPKWAIDDKPEVAQKGLSRRTLLVTGAAAGRAERSEHM